MANLVISPLCGCNHVGKETVPCLTGDSGAASMCMSFCQAPVRHSTAEPQVCSEPLACNRPHVCAFSEAPTQRCLFMFASIVSPTVPGQVLFAQAPFSNNSQSPRIMLSSLDSIFFTKLFDCKDFEHGGEELFQPIGSRLAMHPLHCFVDDALVVVFSSPTSPNNSPPGISSGAPDKHFNVCGMVFIFLEWLGAHSMYCWFRFCCMCVWP